MNTYIAIEIGDSAYTEFKTKGNNFKQTEDGIFLGEIKAKDKKEAEEIIRKDKTRIYDKIIIYEIK